MQKIREKIVLVILLQLLCMAGFCQQNKYLTVGDKVLDLQLDNFINYKNTSLKLSDFKGKLLVLDFWATWCGSCMKSIPLEDSIQSEFRDKIQFLLIDPKLSRDSVYKIMIAKKKLESVIGKKLNLPIVMYDTAATALFHFRLIPHFVWIDKNGVIVAITHKAQITRDNIKAILEDKHITMPIKDDFAKG